MRGRNPQSLCLSAGDEVALRRIADSQTRPWYQVRRARTVLGIATGQRVQTLAEQMQCTPQTIRRTFVLYRQQGLDGLLDDFLDLDRLLDDDGLGLAGS